jgi:hypothetical protein
LATNTATGGKGGAGGNGGTGYRNGGNGGSGSVGGLGLGGAIYNQGNLTVSDCTISDNTAIGGDGGAGGLGGGAGNIATNNNSGLTGPAGAGAAASGGGICNGLNLFMSGSTFARNSVKGGNSPANGTKIDGNGIPGLNGGDGAGGGLCTLWWSGVTNSTFSGNKATGGNGGNGGDGNRWNPGDGGNGGNGVGGGIQNGATLILVNCTLVRSAAYGGTNGLAGNGSARGVDGAVGHPWGGNIASTGGSCLLFNSLIVWESFGGCGYGSFTDRGYNLTSDNSIPLGGTSFPNITQPKIGTLGRYGGPTPTVPLLAGSPAINKIPPDLAPDTDQRGAPRPINDRSDIGAFEYDGSSPPIIFQQPQDQIAISNNPVTFTVSAGGATPLSYQWEFDGTPISGAVGTSYTVTNPSETNAGPYDVVITNRLGSITSDEVFILLAPAITLQPTNQVVSAGSTVTFAAAASGDPPPAFQWLFNSTNVLDGATDPVLTLTDVQMSDIGSYTLTASNTTGSISSSPATLNLLPTITAQPADQSASPGGQAEFSVTAVGSPTLHYQWRKNGAALAGATLSTYANANVQPSDTGTYDVVITNGFGSATSQAAHLQVLIAATGKVVEGTLGLDGVTIPFGPAVAVTDTNGDFSITVPSGTYKLIPARAGYAFQPASLSVSIPASNGLNFQAFPLMFIRPGSNSVVQLSAGGMTGVVYTVEASTNLVDWKGIFTNAAPIQFSDGPSNAARFYRITR